ncbi:DUF4302 domain-containing protein [Wenyingzhuangia sp. 2_MG-2023]|uniref:DUF4302 domain-containing protein n=1 Tax=Wenyingzhuangia sp. 2_MG-2023 TaxID=3062639 RepID=UPI0026E293AF|nr:DUF4302 domain-containing protein [Wenyingzhuangia sp. 2_MG-2023]MDO6736415.1 DUF4302 domain-containing protein [Wenyingzhuangia sp. 2_MG-2023]
MDIKIIENYFKNIALLILLTTVFTACQDEIEVESKFSESAAVRITNNETEIKELLKSSPEGWKTTYFTDNELLGGYTFLFDFEDDKNVRMTSDFDDDFTVATSEYQIVYGSTSKLSFATRNEIHKLSDSDNFPTGDLRGEGYKGDFEFLYYGQEGDDLIFRTNRDFIELRFTKATVDDWTEIEESKIMREKLVSDATTSVYKSLAISDGTTETRYDLSYNTATLFANAKRLNEEGKFSELNFGVAGTKEGLIADPAIETNGVSFKDFVFDSDLSQFVATVDGQTASIGFFDEPAFLTDDVADIGVDLGTFVYALSEGNNALTSPGFDALIDQIETNAGTRFPFETLALFSSPDGSDVELLLLMGGYGFRYTFTSEIKDNKYFLTYVGPRDGNGAFLEAAVLPFIEMFAGPNGLYYTNEGSFNAIKDDGSVTSYSNISGAFVSADSPNIRFYGYWF